MYVCMYVCYINEPFFGGESFWASLLFCRVSDLLHLLST